MPPLIFCRTDTVQAGCLKNDTKDQNEEGETANLSIKHRRSRTTNGISVNFSMTEAVPSSPKQAAQEIMTSSFYNEDDCNILQTLFNERPIWTLVSIRAHLRNPPRNLSYILARIAFYYATGPWRNCFVRFGYDPRKNFESRFYQMLDYRVRQGAGFKGELRRKRRTGTMSKRIKPIQKSDVSMLKDDIDMDHKTRQKQAIFDNDTIPPFRARHYQFCDIHIAKIRDMLSNIPPPLSVGMCNEKCGWLPAGFLEQCRDILTEIANANMMKLCREKNISMEDFKASDDGSTIGPEDIDQDELSSDEDDGQYPDDENAELDVEPDEDEPEI